MSGRTRLGYLAAGLTLLFGLAALLVPYWAVLAVGFDFSTQRPWGISEMRSVYGALFVMMGALMLWALPRRPRNAPYLRMAGLLWLAAALGRVLSMLIDGALVPMNFALLALELFIGLTAFFASFEKPRRAERQEMAIPDRPPYP